MEKKKSKTPSGEFLERMELIKADLKISTKKHQMKMEELKYSRESDRLHHERELERGRIKTAEIRKSQMRKYSADPYKN